MKTKIQKWGNSLAVRLPKGVVQQKSLTEGEGVLVLVKNDLIVIETEKKNSSSLEEMISQITPENRYDETDWGEPVGKEVW
jgi:antitoxin MazE